jgi:pimeloyl-ACP methyl ester carboxylesterase
MTPLVLIPGLLCDGRLWHHQIDGLKKHVNVIVADITRGSTLREISEALLDAAPARFALAGFSLGSQVALEIMRLAKERVERLALLSATRGGLPTAVEAAIRRAVALLEEDMFDQYLEAAYSTYFAPSRAEAPGLRRCFMDMAHAVGRDAGLRQMRALLGIRAPFENLGEIRCPTMILGGKLDQRTTPVEHEALAGEIPGSTLVMVDGAAHFTPLEQPGAVMQALAEWLRL